MNARTLDPESLDGSVTVVTSTARLARALREAHAQAMRAQGAVVWATPDVLPWSAWLARGFAALRAGGHVDGALLSPAGRDALWREVVSDDAGARILSPDAAAASAARAESLLLDHADDAGGVILDVTAETRAFARWRGTVNDRAGALGYVNPASLGLVFEANAGAVAETLRPGLRVCGFDELPATHARMLDALRRAGVDVAAGDWRHPGRTASARVHECEDAGSELTAAAAWCRRLLDSGAGGPVGVVIPDLDARLAEVHDVFADVLAGAPFHVSLGPPLAAREMVADALAMLRACADTIDVNDAGRLLLSTYVKGANHERGARARLHADLLESGYATVRPDQLVAPTHAPEGPLGVWSTGLSVAQAVTGPRAAPASAWAARAAEILGAFGWPGDRPLDSVEHQVLHAWNELLDGFASLDDVHGRALSFAEAVSMLSRMAAGTVFAPKAQPAPVQIMGLLESTGLRFEHLRVCGLDDDRWPPPARPTPFLPYALQREARMPNASPALALERAQLATEGWLRSASGEVVLSYARTDGDAERSASPLLDGFEAGAEEGWERAPLAFDAIRAAAPSLEPLVDWSGPPLAEGADAPGGSGALEDYAACPFRAFARRRLGASAPARRAAPPDPMTRGLVLHDAVRRAWAAIGTQAALERMTTQELRRVAGDAVERAMAPLIKRHGGAMHVRIVDIERERAVDLVTLWLERERAREAFEVLAHERTIGCSFGGVQLRLRIDRIDRLGDGRALLVDYKTAKTLSAGSWLGERPEAPQLPLYAAVWPDAAAGIGAPRELAGLCFAQLHRASLGFKGFGRGDQLPPGVTEVAALKGKLGAAVSDFGAWLEESARTLGALARGFADGDAVVDPRDEKTACDRCDLHALCREAELYGARTDDEPEDATRDGEGGFE